MPKCPKCGKECVLPEAAVHLNGVLRCKCGVVFAYKALAYYDRKGGLKPKWVEYREDLVERSAKWLA